MLADVLYYSHMKRIFSLLLILLAALLIVGSMRYLALFDEKIAPGDVIQVEEVIEPAAPEVESPALPVEGFELSVVAEQLYVPWSIVFTSADRMLVSERNGRIRVITNGELASAPLHVFEDISTQAEEGLMGLAVDPQYASNRYIYACYAYANGDGLKDRVVRFTDAGDTLENEVLILDDIPAARFHAGCRLGFGPDGKLYITTGDATDKNLAQDLNSLAGKILRINADGSIPADNPFEGSAVYSYGHRNAQGIDWHPVSGKLLSTEHGPSIFDGPAGGDEINNIYPGENYGWPLVSHDDNEEGLIAPVIQFTPAEAPGSALVYSGALFPAWKGNLFFGALKGAGIVRVAFTDDQAIAIAEIEKLDINVGRIREVTEGPDGAVYFSTSNRDGRGDLQPGDDKIFSIVPLTNEAK